MLIFAAENHPKKFGNATLKLNQAKGNTIKTDIQALILALRPDVKVYISNIPGDFRTQFLGWLVTSGIKEYKAVSEDPKLLELFVNHLPLSIQQLTSLQSLIYLIRSDLQEAFPLPKKIKSYLKWFYTSGLNEYHFWPFLSQAEKNFVLELGDPWRARITSALYEELLQQSSKMPFHLRTFGVNLIGYAFGQLGIGEDVRMVGRALLAVNEPMTILNFFPGVNVPQNDYSMTAFVSDKADFAFNIFCLTAEETGRFYLERGRSQFVDRYNIGYWPWELSQWPQQWEMMLDLVDEVWVSTKHTYDALAPVCQKPLYIMPMAVELGPVTHFTSQPEAREAFKLPAKAKLFCFAFDLNSSVDRKNPQACVDAFLAAFPITEFSEQAVGLVIKVHKPTNRNRAWEKLKKLAAEDARIHIIEGTLSRPDLLALYAACDCFISLHRAEGFGRGLAEALQLGLHVICTGYSGNVDFCNAPYADLVDYRLIKVKKNQYPHSEGQVWADPSVEHAAALMRHFVLHPPRHQHKKSWPEFSPEVVGKRYQDRLGQIYAEMTRSTAVLPTK